MIGNNGKIIEPSLQLVAWEITSRCNLFCAHCRMSNSQYNDLDELGTDECFKIIDQIVEAGRPVIILTGGEPLLRNDIAEIGRYATHKGLRVVMGSNGTLITRELAEKLNSIPLSRLSVSIDFPSADLQDKFRGRQGAFDAAIKGISNVKQAGIEIQVNSTITKLNVKYLAGLLDLAIELGAVAFHPFMLVPTGRGNELKDQELSPQEYEDTLNWIYDKQQELAGKIFFKPTDAPHYFRIIRQRRNNRPDVPVFHHGHTSNTLTRGCLAGTGFCFISAQGKVKGCGYLDIEAGNLKEQSFVQIWNQSPLFMSLRDLSNLKGKCGACEYKVVCGGCRARALEATGDYLEAEPYCIYQPHVCQKAE